LARLHVERAREIADPGPLGRDLKIAPAAGQLHDAAPRPWTFKIAVPLGH